METSTLPLGIIGFLASLLVAAICHGNPDMKHNLWIIVPTERYLLHIQAAAGMFPHIIESS